MDLSSNQEQKPIVVNQLHGLQLSPPLTPENQSYLEYSTSSPESNTSQSNSEPPRRYRTQYTPDQLASLEKEYHRDNYVTRQKRKELADLLGLHESKIKVWFQNRRMKDKRTRVVYPWPYATLPCTESYLPSRAPTMTLPNLLPPFAPFYHPYHHMQQYRPQLPTMPQMALPALSASHMSHLPHGIHINLEIPKLESPPHYDNTTTSYADTLLMPTTNLVQKTERRTPKLFQPYNLCK